MSFGDNIPDILALLGGNGGQPGAPGGIPGLMPTGSGTGGNKDAMQHAGIRADNREQAMGHYFPPPPPPQTSMLPLLMLLAHGAMPAPGMDQTPDLLAAMQPQMDANYPELDRPDQGGFSNGTYAEPM